MFWILYGLGCGNFGVGRQSQPNAGSSCCRGLLVVDEFDPGLLKRGDDGTESVPSLLAFFDILEVGG